MATITTVRKNKQEDTLKNLRLLAVAKKREYLSTSNDGQIEYVVQFSHDSGMTPAMWGRTWKSNAETLDKLFTEDVPQLIDELIEGKQQEELESVGQLLSWSKGGLMNLKWIFDRPYHAIFLDCLTNNYLDKQLARITLSLDRTYSNSEGEHTETDGGQ